jgi:hypothetical protein
MDRKRRWTGFAVALTVTFTVCDAQQIGLSPSDSSFSSGKRTVAIRTVRPEQKAPPVLAPLRLVNTAFSSRKQASGNPRAFDGYPDFRYAWITPFQQLDALISQPKTGEITRGPPRMDPPFSC